MLSFSHFLDEAFQAMMGDSGFKEKHAVPFKDANGNDHVLHGDVRFHHMGNGHYTLFARTSVDGAKPSFRPKGMKDVPSGAKLEMAKNARRSFTSFMSNHKDKVNSVNITATNKNLLDDYRRHLSAYAEANREFVPAHNGKNASLVRSKKIDFGNSVSPLDRPLSGGYSSGVSSPSSSSSSKSSSYHRDYDDDNSLSDFKKKKKTLLFFSSLFNN